MEGTTASSPRCTDSEMSFTVAVGSAGDAAGALGRSSNSTSFMSRRTASAGAFQVPMRRTAL